MMNAEINAEQIAAVIRAWERRRDPLDDSPYDAFRAAHRIEAHYLWLLANGYGPPADVQPSALRNLVRWGLVREEAIVTPLGCACSKRRAPSSSPIPSHRSDQTQSRHSHKRQGASE